jgi:type IV secretion system protein VirD4
MFLDEFPSIGYMPIIKKGSGYIAGFKLKLLTIYQNISQLNEIYGIEGAKTLMSAHPAGLSMLSVKKMMLKRFQKSLAIHH